MAFIQRRRVTAGFLITGTFQELGIIKREIAMYCGGFFGLALISSLLPFTSGLIGFVATIGYFLAQYYLYRMILERGGGVSDPPFKIFSFVGMALLLVVPLYIAFAFLVIPGILLASMWIIAPSFLVAEEGNAFEALGKSWSAASQNLGAIALAFTVLCLIWIVGVTVIGGIGGGFDELLDTGSRAGGVGQAFSWLVFHILPLLLMGLSVSAYRALNDSQDSLISVFE